MSKDVEIKELLKQLDLATFSSNTTEIERINRQLLKIRATLSHIGIQRTYVPYPDISDPSFENTILAKKEFNKYKYRQVVYKDKSFEQLSKEYCDKNDFKLSNNQQFLRNFMSPRTGYNGLLLFHGVGIGKTCSAITIAEQFKHVFTKPVLVLMPKTLRDQFLNQIYNHKKTEQCTGQTYSNVISNKDLSDTDIKKRTDDYIETFYDVSGPAEFSKTVTSITHGQPNHVIVNKIREHFSNRVIIVDEVHNMRITENDKLKTTHLKLVLQHAENVKLILLSATPMYDKANEIVEILNFLLANDKRELLRMDDVFDSKTSEMKPSGEALLSNACKGYVSYMRGQNPFSFPIKLSPKFNNDDKVITNVAMYDHRNNIIQTGKATHSIDVVGSVMSPHQAKAYNRFAGRLQDKKSRLQEMTLVSNMVYPYDDDDLQDGNHVYGDKAITKSFIKHVGKTGNSTYSYKDKNQFMNQENIGKYSAKIKSIMEYIEKSTGIVFVYSNFIDGGIIPLAMALEHMGYNRYNGENCFKHLKNKKVAGKSYIMITGVDSDKTQSLIDAVRDDKNKNGDIVKVILGSSVTSEGIDFKNIREVHILDPWFNFSRIEQVIGRALRNCSHTSLPIEQRNVTIFFHASILKKNDDTETYDTHWYRKAQNKLSVIKQVETILQRNAIDCNLNINSMHLNLDTNVDVVSSQSTSNIVNLGVVEKHYQSMMCAKPLDADTVKLDDSTFHMDHYSKEIQKCKKDIVALYTQEHSYSYHDFVNMISVEDKDVLIYALDTMIVGREQVVNEFGKKGFIINRGTQYIFQDGNTDTRTINVHRSSNHVKTTIRLVIQQNKTNINQVVTDDQFNSIREDLLKRIETLYNIAEFEDPQLDFVYDFYVDRLNENDIQVLCLHYMNNQVATDRISGSLRRGLYIQYLQSKWFFCNVHKFEKPKINDVRNPYITSNGEIEIYKTIDGVLHRLSPLDRILFEEHNDHPFVPISGVIGFMQQKKGVSDFQIVDRIKNPNSPGSSCAANSILKKADLLANILSQGREYFVQHLKNDVGKHSLCEIRELYMRAFESSKFVRPFMTTYIRQKI